MSANSMAEWMPSLQFKGHRPSAPGSRCVEKNPANSSGGTKVLHNAQSAYEAPKGEKTSPMPGLRPWLFLGGSEKHSRAVLRSGFRVKAHQSWPSLDRRGERGHSAAITVQSLPRVPTHTTQRVSREEEASRVEASRVESASAPSNLNLQVSIGTGNSFGVLSKSLDVSSAHQLDSPHIADLQMFGNAVRPHPSAQNQH